MASSIFRGLLDGLILLIAQLIPDCRRGIQDAMVLPKLVEAHLRGIRLYLEPLGIRLVGDVEFLQIPVEVGVPEGFTRVLVGCVAMPVDDVVHVGGMCLLLDTGLYILLGIADLCPTFMTGNLGSRISVNLRECGARCLNLACDVIEGHG